MPLFVATGLGNGYTASMSNGANDMVLDAVRRTKTRHESEVFGVSLSNHYGAGEKIDV